MKTIILEQAGGVENLIYKETNKPTPLSNEVLIEVKAISVNPVDFKVRSNKDVMNAIYGTKRPAILGWDIAGIVTEIGAGVHELKVGDRVFGMINFPGEGEGYANFVCAKERHITKIPENISYEQAAATTLAALTALQVLKNRVSKGNRVLIHAGSGGVGHFAIQIAKALGAYVITTCSIKNKDFVISLGADQHIDYRKEAFEEVLSNVDFVFDMFNGDILYNSVKVVKEGGKIVSIPTPEFSNEITKLALDKKVDVSFLMVTSNGDDMKILASYLSKGIIKPHISKTFSFDDMKEAHRHLESGRTIGKIVLTL